MNIMLDTQRVRKILATEGHELVEELCSTAKRGGDALTRIDELARELSLKLGEDLLMEIFTQIAQSIRNSGESTPACQHCGEPMSFKQMRPGLVVRTVLTGEERKIPSPYLVCDDCRTGVLSMRELLGLDRDGFTERLREVSIQAGVLEPFESAAEQVMNELVGVRVSGTKIHSLCQHAGGVAQELMDKGELGVARPLKPGEKLYVEADGGMLHIDGDWHEAKLAIAFPQTSLDEISKNRKAISERRACCTLGTREELGDRLFKMVSPYLPMTADGTPIISGNVVVLGDGSPWIQNMVQETLPGAAFLLDWYHVCDHVSDTAKVLFKDDDKQRRRWRTRQKNMLRSGRVNAMLDGLRRKCMQLPAGSEPQQAVASLHRYLDERRSALKYAEARSAGLNTGSGAIESAIGHVLQQRMKRSGMRWGEPGANCMAALRCAYRSTGGMTSVFEKMKEAKAA